MQRGADQEIGAGQERRQVVAPAEKSDAPGDAKTECHPLEPRAQRAFAGDPQLDPARRRQRFEQQFETLVAIQPPERDRQ